MSAQNILVVGGAGFIGSHVTKMLATRGYHPIVFDNLSSGHRDAVKEGTFIRGDLANADDLDGVFSKHKIDVVMHFAALIDVGESVVDPVKYMRHNVGYTLNLLHAMRQHGVHSLIFSSTAAIFGNPVHPSINENHPCLPINPYGETKLAVEKILHYCDAAYGIKSSCLRYFNAAGGDPDGEIKNFKTRETNLIPLTLRSLKKSSKPLVVYGTDYPTRDGTCIRDYIHLEDLGAAHILALEKVLSDRLSTCYNLGNGNGFTVREVIQATESVTGLKVPFIEGPRRPGDPPQLVASSLKANTELGWKPVYPGLEDMIAHAWKALSI
ncbi:MAG: UDP-glucose 4-epimerase GalE [Parachlamydiaceae bacterium]